MIAYFILLKVIAVTMQGIKRKIVYVSTFEFIAIFMTSLLLALLSDQSMSHTSVAGIASSLIAIVWNLVYNTLFEYWESKQQKKGRSVLRRIVHATLFEAGLVAMLVPLFAWWLDITLWQAFVYDIGLIIFFLCYTFIFNLCFDRIFGLPASAQPAPSK